MSMISLSGHSVLIAGGDARELVLAAELEKAGANVWLYGFSSHPDAGIRFKEGLPLSADTIIMPLSGINDKGVLYTSFSVQNIVIEDLEHLFLSTTLILCGRMPLAYVEFCQKKGSCVILTAEMDELAIHNAIPTAEGTLEIAMRESQITIHGSNALVTGLGRCGLPLARILAALGARVTVAARRREVRAVAETFGFSTIGFDQLQALAHSFNFLFNTVPAPVLTEDILTQVRKDAIIIDIASAPGGTDFVTANRLGLKSFLSLGLPGKVAPITAGKILTKVYHNLINIHKKGGEQG